MTAVRTSKAPSGPRLEVMIAKTVEKAVAPLRVEIERLREEIDAIEDAAAERLLALAPDEERFPAKIAERLVAGENPIRIFREYRGMTQAALAKASGTSAQYLSQIERGDREAGRKLLPRIAESLRIDEEMLR